MQDRNASPPPPAGSARRSLTRAALRGLGILGVSYAVLVMILAASQTLLLFPRWAVAPAPVLPANAEQVRIDRSGGVILHGHRIRGQSGEAPVLAFGGNAWNAAALALFLHGILPERDIVAFHFRGYTPSTGRPSAAALAEDALAIHDWMVGSGYPAPLVAGFSIGTGPAAWLAAHRPVAGVILVTPFDTLLQLIRDHYPWMPVQIFLRHRMDPAADLQDSAAPVAIIAAARDEIVFPGRTDALRRALAGAIPGVVMDRTIQAGHNDLYSHPEMSAALRDAVAALVASSRGAGDP